MKITKKQLDTFTPPATKQIIHRDSILKGFAVRVTPGGTKSFVVEKRINGQVKRVTLGRYPELTVEQARKEAQKLLGKIATGIDPIAEKKATKAKAVTLAQAFDDYLKARKSLKETTIFDYKRVMREAFADWQNKPLLNISKDMIAKRHSQLGEASHARSNLAMRVLRAIFNFATGEYEDANGQSLILENPVKRLSHTKAWYRVQRRQTVIRTTDLPNWYQAVVQLEDERSTGKSATIRDYLLLILFTGLRRGEAARLKWEQVDLKAKLLTIIDTKNYQPHTLPLSSFLYDLLTKRHNNRTSDYVFPGDGKNGYIVEPRKVMQKVIDASGVSFTLHDLRRTFITVAESLDIPAYALKRLLNHKMNQDVTAGYIVMDVERLRKPMEMISDYYLRIVNMGCELGVVDFRLTSKSSV